MKDLLFKLLVYFKETGKLSSDSLELDKEKYNQVLEYADREGYITGIKFSRGGQGNRILMSFTDSASITEKGYDFLDTHIIYSDEELLELMISFISENSGGKRPLNLTRIRKGLPKRLDRNTVQYMLNNLIDSKVVRKVKGRSYKGPDGRMTSDDYYELRDSIRKPSIAQKVGEVESMTDRNQVFIIHGHDVAMKTSVQLLMERADIDGVVLHEQPDKGRTIIEKLIGESSNAGYAIALLSPDDISDGGVYRARQNVILEIGYFIGVLGRDKVRILVKGNVDIPSDLQGIIYEPFDDSGNWRIRLLREIREAGIPVDIERVISKL